MTSTELGTELEPAAASPVAASPAAASPGVGESGAVGGVPTASTPGASGAPRRGKVRRFLGWFWASSQFEALRREQRVPSAQTTELLRRARAALELAEAALDPSRRYAHGPMDALACELCAQAVYWALQSQRSLEAAAVSASAPDFQKVWDGADPSELARAAGGREPAELLGRSIVGQGFADFAALSPDEQARLARNLRAFAEGLCAPVESARVRRERIQMLRALRIGGLLGLIAIVVVGVLALRERAEVAADIAKGKAWVASSRYPDGGCQSPAQECSGSPNYFFSTNEEENPWMEIDLGSVQSVSGLHVFNRIDCCSERAAPLIVSASSDHVRWQQIARQKDDFRDWKTSFAPVRARWVRFTVPRRSLLHFRSVRLFH